MFPARAGMNRRTIYVSTLLIGVPRTRGDEPDTRLMPDGKSHVFPARAGMNRAYCPTM